MCFIIPQDVLLRLADDDSVADDSRTALAATAASETAWRTLREAHTEATQAGLVARIDAFAGVAKALAKAPGTPVFDCKHTMSLPGVAVASPGSSTDASAKSAFTETAAVAKFYKECFGRNSVDDEGMTLVSSVHYSVNYSNAFWNGSQMTYGDGDGEIFVDFTASNDVIGHELTHGVTQYTAGLLYKNEAGGLNESMSDVFGSMFRQWSAGQTVDQADWLIGKDIMGPRAVAKGFTCLRDMADPGARHCLAPQPSHYRDYVPGSDPHESSGIPNYAFYLAATKHGSYSWQGVGTVWYEALTSPKARPNMKMKAFANLTREISAANTATESVHKAIDDAWTAVGL
ncbi:M4 family metallopeptidase [Mycobacteroides abscessus]|uniref:Neutral metalloproteinase n=3 Tax=Mycobacteroides abscessus TaxID=36809 RepID=A0AB38D4V7_9MYCO|nr:M4 family metallopeptidase [Mycobacteroides abscessus]EUA47459.1 thermolysin metallopeptidase, catalytic domain protein [Mycobacteroides abscessus 21]AMU20795.1 peptidase [Mycobacteroides abscessus]AMU70046.1 peptidase [Mycobacteroides abscessus]EHM21025.1 putative metalloprotease [Mycobacteroides abscessus subsp. bolletii BD]EIC70102.1 putative metalloprotease [Mycobacteroides abscessus M94]